ncbi:50S ribosomal protein L9, partial [Lactobacillus amylovorus]|uniref:50S ribosomal protein L9 n=1 Tax=Lactobacillus amylovorus TaxID=1604 RepID=UPI00313EEFAD
DVRGRGKRGQVKEVPDGYAQNYLITRGLAKAATKGNMNTLKRVEANEKAAYEAAKAEAEKIKAEREKESTSDNIKSKAGNESRLFGSISSKTIVEG